MPSIKRLVSEHYVIFAILACAGVGFLVSPIAYVLMYNAGVEIFGFSKTLIDTLPYVYVGLIGIAATLAAIYLSRQGQRKQDTLKILLESRLSKHHYSLLNSARRYLASPNGVTGKKYRQDIKSGNKDAEATREILNHYDFLSSGILEKNLDEKMLHRTIRGMLCKLAFDARHIIHHVRVTEGKHRTYENLATVYDRWAIRDRNDEWEDGFDIGPILDD